MPGMEWHTEPTDDAWRRVHLEMVQDLGKRLWLNCDWRQHMIMAEVSQFGRDRWAYQSWAFPCEAVLGW